MKTGVAGALAAGFLSIGVAEVKADATAGQLARACADYPSQTESSALCLGYISGALDAFRTFNRLGGKLFCETNSATADVIVQAVKNDLLRHPEKSSTQAASVILGALSEVFPCK
jgi:hypothetical protein